MSGPSPSSPDPGLFSAPKGPDVGRRRTAPRAERPSDVTRFRGVLVASVAAALAVLGAVVATIDPATERAPGPLSRPHAEASLACTSCHVKEQPVVAQCVGCHGPHPSTRPGHRRLMAANALACTDCHAVHDDFGGIAFDLTGVPWRFGPGAAQPVEDGPRLVPAPAVEARVPVVPLGSCDRCHRPERTGDPIHRCLLGDRSSWGPEQPTVCFDEHRAFGAEAFTRGEGVYERARLWAAARQAVARAPTPPPPPVPDRSAWAGLLLAAAFGLLAFGIARGLAHWAGRRRPAVPAGAVVPPTVRRLPQIDTTTCIGCHACVDACPYDVLEVRSFVAHVVRPDDCCGLTLCEQRCPNGSLVVTDGEPIEDRPRVDETLESRDTPGIYVAGDLTGLPLIRNAINQGARATRAAIESLRAEGGSAASGESGVLDLVVVGSGPAGLSASLAAAEARVRTVTLEQGSVAESIRSFPRGKLVFDQPLGLPLEGDLWLRESTKEELLGQWRRIIRARRLPIEQGVRVTAVTRRPGPRPCFEIEGQTAHGVRRWVARRVILALGRRGTPRKLAVPIPEALIGRVHYSLADARSLAGRRVLVVGLGDVAMEAAVALARQPDTTVTVSYRGDDFRRGKGRNIEQVKRLVAAGRIDLRLRTEVERVEAETITLRGSQGAQSISWDTMLVMIGALAPWAFLESAGVPRARVSTPSRGHPSEGAVVAAPEAR
ncbi:MAG: NAD(P)-binding domain-containing protein [Myxococcota bacterium]